jgi:uncharacterized protein YjiS (DUF1127 family)
MTTANVAVPVGSASFAEIARGLGASFKAARVLRTERSRVRAELTRCSDRELAEIGLSRADIDGVVAGLRRA